MIRNFASVFTLLLIFEVSFGAAFMTPSAVRGVLWRESMARETLLAGASLRAAEGFEAASLDLVGGFLLPLRAPGTSDRMPGLARSELPEEAAFRRALSGIFASPWGENVRLMGLLFLKRLSILFSVLLMGALPIVVLALDGWHALQVRMHAFGAMRPSVFGGLGFLILPGFGATMLLLAFPADIEPWVWGFMPLLLGAALRELIRNWHRF